MDRAALDAAMDAGISVGGWCPRGRLAEDGRISSKYPLKETTEKAYAVRTERNVLDSDGTLILHDGEISGGTGFTLEIAIANKKPWLAIDLTTIRDGSAIVQWLRKMEIRVLNIAGPRESGSPGIYERAYAFVRIFLEQARSE